jgi:sugar lactone lactonase YvrE
MVFAENLGVPEGPVVLDDGSWLVVEMGPKRGCVTRLDQDGRIGRVIARTGRPNGLAVDRDGTIWVAQSQDPSFMDGRAEVVLTAWTAGSLPTNVAFRLEEQRIYVTEDEFGRVETFEVGTEGLRLYA